MCLRQGRGAGIRCYPEAAKLLRPLADVARREEGQSRTIALHYLDLLALREEGV